MSEALDDGKHRWVVEADIKGFFDQDLELAEEKSALVKFNRWEPENSGRFTFLGFDFHWAVGRYNRNYRKAAFTEAWERWKIPSPRVVEKPWPRTTRQSQPQPIRNVQPIRVRS